MAGRARLLQTNFGGGEISRASRARPDTDIYSGALEKCLNYLVRPSGAADRRGGSVYLGSARDTTAGKRWFVFQKAVNDVIRIEAGNGYFRFWDGITRTLIESGGSPVEVAIPWSDTELAGLRTWQKGDVMWFAHTGHTYPVKVLKRTSSTSFTLTDYDFDEGPFRDLDAGQATLTFSGVTGSITITSPSDVFLSGHAGALMRIEANTLPDVDGWSFDQRALVGWFCRNGNNFYECTAAPAPGKTGNFPPIHTSGLAWDGNTDDNVQWEFKGFSYGLLQITAVTDARNASATVLSRLPFYGAAALTTDIWQMQALSDAYGWPACGVFVEDRFSVFGSTENPDRCDLGRTSRYTSDSADMRPGFATETLDDDAVRRSLADDQTAYILWAKFMDQLLLGTTLGVKSLVGPSQDEAITPAGAVPRTVTEIPCSPDMPPVKADNALIYAALGNEELIEVSRTRDAVPRNLLELADHMAGGGLRSFKWQGRPRRVLWAVDRQSRLVSMTYSPENGTIAWARHRLGGSNGSYAPAIDDVCAAPGPDGKDELWLIVERQINGGTVRTVEYFERPYDSDTMRVEEACCLDMSGAFNTWQSYTVLATDLGSGQVRLNAQGGAIPFVGGDIGRQFWLTGNGEFIDEDDEPMPIKVEVITQDSTSQLTCRFVGSYPSALWAGRVLRVARPTTSLSGLSWLEGESVYVNADGIKRGPFTVSSASINLTTADGETAWAARGWVGLSNKGFARTLPVNGGEGLGSARTAVGRVTGIGVLPDGIAEGIVRRADGESGRDVELNPRTMSHKPGAAPPPLTDDEYIPLDTGFDRSKQIEIEATGPLPCSIAGFMLQVSNYG